MYFTTLYLVFNTICSNIYCPTNGEYLLSTFLHCQSQRWTFYNEWNEWTWTKFNELCSVYQSNSVVLFCIIIIFTIVRFRLNFVLLKKILVKCTDFWLLFFFLLFIYFFYKFVIINLMWFQKFFTKLISGYYPDFQ